MARSDKLYIRLDEMLTEYTGRLQAEFEQEQAGTKTDYLKRKRRMFRETGNSFHMASYSTGREGANEMLMLEKEIIVLCAKLNEPQPLALQLLSDYLAAIAEKVSTAKGYVTEEDDFGGWHTTLRTGIIARLKAGE